MPICFIFFKVYKYLHTFLMNM